MPTPITAAPRIWLAPRLGVDDAAAVEDGEDAAYAKARDLQLPLDLGEVAPEGMQRIFFRLGIFH